MSQTSKITKIRVLVVDDSKLMRTLITHILESDPEINVIGTAINGEEALDAVRQQNPDVVTMDYHMPKMNGLKATQKIMETYPVPIVIISKMVAHDETILALNMLDAGAVAIAVIPSGINQPGYEASAKKLVKTIKAMAEVKVVRRWKKKEVKISVPPKQLLGELRHAVDIKLVAIGSSTGGPAVLKTILSNLPKNNPISILIVQHIAMGFTLGLTEWLSQSTGFKVRVAVSGEKIQAGHAYVAPDGVHMEITKGNIIALSNIPPINSHRPSVSVLFRSVATTLGANAVGILLTGMGKDGAAELKLMKEHGALTIVQDEKTSVIYGMPGEAVKLDAASLILTPEEIAIVLSKLIKKNQHRKCDG